jgi:hypothetical protein
MTTEQAVQEARMRWRARGYAGHDKTTGEPWVGLIKDLDAFAADQPYEVITLGMGKTFEEAFAEAERFGRGDWRGVRATVRTLDAERAKFQAIAEGHDA